ncbi:nucleotidyltransferase family protein [Spongiibacter marinus]|uniref:nucleotidyltransferase family protein n=1 Tax=Spongiibacter marinus TaxID=354246 RepID=UPI0004062B92|nr:nucleotidyltransferase family protein [Spongiibacter marinus]
MAALPLLLLAAGRSRRFGEQDKRFTPLPKGGEMLPALIRRAGKAGAQAFAVLSESDRHNNVAAKLDAPCFYARRAEEGMGFSLAEGMRALLQHLGCTEEQLRSHTLPSSLPEAVLIMPADLPLLRITTISQLINAACADDIVVPRCQGRAGHPVAFGRKYWPALCAVIGTQGGKGVIQDPASTRRFVDVSDPGIYSDVDTPEQLLALAPHFTPP